VNSRRHLRPRLRATVPIGALLVLVGSGALPCHWAEPTPAAAQSSGAREVRVSLTEWALIPARITVPAGLPIRFAAANQGALPHSLAVEGPDTYAESEAAGSGGVAYLELTFQAPGLYDIFCPINAGQHRALGQEGVLNVVPAGPVALLPRTGDAERGAGAAADAVEPAGPAAPA
jgi:plastocyanin